MVPLQINPVTRGVILLLLIGGWSIASLFLTSSLSSDLTQESLTPKRHLLAVDEEAHGEAQDRDELEAEGEAAPTSAPEEIVTRIELIPPSNGSQEPCAEPAVKQFPSPILGRSVRRHGGILLHVLIAVYMFIGLAIVCDEYFVPALERMSDVLGLSPDVAGATFMSAGSSAPELSTAVIGVFVAKDDIGVSGVVGSAVFNITLVIGVCALCARHSITLNWYSMCRDCFCYLIAVIVLIATIANRVITWYEATLFISLYVLYCVFMAFNPAIEAWATKSLPVPDSWKSGGKEGENQEMETMEDGTKVAEGEEENKEEWKDPLIKPLALDDGQWAVFSWYVTLPFNYLCVYTIPNCNKPDKQNMYVPAFLISIVWICLYSYVMVWMITVIGFTLGIPDNVMGLTFIAAGVSVPDALGGISVVKDGHGDMAVSNAIGSNVFDILMCLGLPWFIKTVILEPGTVVEVQHKGILYSTLTLFSTIVFLIGTSHANNFKMDKSFGIKLIIWYFIAISVASLYE